MMNAAGDSLFTSSLLQANFSEFGVLNRSPKSKYSPRKLSEKSQPRSVSSPVKSRKRTISRTKVAPTNFSKTSNQPRRILSNSEVSPSQPRVRNTQNILQYQNVQSLSQQNGNRFTFTPQKAQQISNLNNSPNVDYTSTQFDSRQSDRNR